MNDAWLKVQLAREFVRPTAQYYIHYLIENFYELHGDRYEGDDAAIIGGVGMFRGRPVTVIAQEKGSEIAEKVKRNFGSVNPKGYRKSIRLAKQAAKFHRPVIMIVDTQGAYCGMEAEQRGIGEAIARNLMELSRLKTPIVTILIGEGGSGGALAMAVCDKIAMLENSVYSILSPEGFASILWKDASQAPKAATLMRMTADEVCAMGIVDDVIPEPKEGAKNDDEGKMAQLVGDYIESALDELTQIPAEELVCRRYEKIRAFGTRDIRE